MDEDMEEVEIVFAQRLASGEPTARQRAMKHLRTHIRERTKTDAKGFSSVSLARLCKGLHYALWMQDKMTLQEELADEICALCNYFRTDEQLLEFVVALFTTLSKEWPHIDRWRMDKFLMLVRRLVRTLFRRLSSHRWDSPLCDQFLQMFRSSLLSANSPLCESLKFHCASVWLDELDTVATAKVTPNEGNAGKNCDAFPLDAQRSLDFVWPYVQLLQEQISDSFFRTICSDIFDAILCDFEQRKAEKTDENCDEKQQNVTEDEEEKKKTEEKSSSFEFDYKRIGELLFEVGKQQKVPSRRRKRIYALCKKFECAAQGDDPFPVPNLEGVKMRKKKRRRKNSSS
ncbi:hypothetical protein niasHS_010066 [Heterodera schachtii]|uniref:Uncharacterized protein n=1 Tax=Heterodera schachtii TaxID=97005 RepID=A0ABD2IYL3_HETSC